jgi:hypothetical protein
MNFDGGELVFDEKFELQIRTDPVFAKKIFEKAASEVDQLAQ